MKKGCKLLIVLFCLLLFSGCVKENVEMNVNVDKSMDISIIMGLNKSLLNSGDDTFSHIDSSKKTLEEEGYQVEDYDDGTYKGYKLTKHVNNIDDFNINNDFKINSQDNNQNSFIVNKGFLINRYSASLSNFANTNSLSNTDDYANIANTYLSSMDLKFVLNVPYKTISNNATSVENDGKRLIWNLSTLGNNPIKFEFNMFNIIEAIVLIVAAVLVFILIIIAIIKNKKKKNNDLTKDNQTLETNNNVDNNIDIEIID